MKDELKSFYTAVLLSLVIIFATNYFFAVPEQEELAAKEPEVAVVKDVEIGANEEADAKKDEAEEPVLSAAEVMEENPHVMLENQVISGSIRIKGARIDNLWLKKYKQTMEENSPDVELLSPAKTKNPYYAEFGWLSSDKSFKLPDANTVWNVKGKSLSPAAPLVLEWDNGEGLRFITKIALDENYMFTVTQAIENNTDSDVLLFPYGVIARKPQQSGLASVVHEGLIGVFNDKLEEVKYKDLAKKQKEFETSGGWFGFSDRYWFSSVILDNNSPAKVKFSNNGEFYQADFVGDAINIASGSTAQSQNLFYAGAKEIKLIDNYAKNLNIKKFDLAVDFGWYYFLTKPFFYILDYLYNLIGNMGWAILLFAALLRLAMFPIANKSYENMAKMKKIQPKLKELQEKFAADKVKLQQETLLLYQKEKINPASGCLPMFIQIPVFFSLYKVLNIAIEIRQAPFIGWIKDLSAPDPLLISDWTGLPVPSVLNIGVWPIIMGLTMYIQQKLSPAPTNKDQARAFALMPLIFMFMMGHFASGLVIYWSFSNLLSIIQQRAIIIKNKD
ncbi:MAG: membrane protein insertase YidC [Alphaproteobacteria bacterium]|nr:membrane protein insertase YidC [Alphaproteobacteria bacterium]